ncbi:MAG: class B sortase [Lachnospiraceae bacterium]|nr:class B sortase [Lachnospiraceae bacterium]
MSGNDFPVSRSEFRTQADFEAAMRDKRKIQLLLQRHDSKTAQGAEQLYQALNSGEVRFETVLGDRFDDAVYELHKKLRQEDRTSSKGQGKSAAAKNSSAKKTGGKKSLEDYDPEMQKQILFEMRKAEKRRRTVILFFVLFAIAGFGYYVYYYFSADKENGRGDQLSNLVGSDTLVGLRDPEAYVAHLTDEGGNEVTLEVLDQYKTLYNLNQDLIGWIKIDDTIIDYPVMQGEDNTYYLSHNFDKKEEKAGALFLDCNCDIIRGNDNFIIYGHHLTSGRMFSKLGEYESRRYYEKHPYIHFDTIYEEGTYQVMYAFRSRVYDADDVRFKYYQFIDAQSEEEFNSYMREMSEQAFYDTGVTARYGDRLLTLSTCDYQEQNGRFVVVAKKIQ